jgi:hypothetical protein
MAVPCSDKMQAQQVGAKFVTMTKCSQGHGPNLEPMELLEKCLTCPSKIGKKRIYPVPKRVKV